MLVDLIVHADWGTDPRKRVACVAQLQSDGTYTIDATQPVGQDGDPRERLGIAAGASAFLGFDFPIGVPAAYAARAGITSFREVLAQLGRGEWAEFFRVSERAEEIGLHRPFYPQRPGGTRVVHLESALGLQRAELYRRCELKTGSRSAACPLFWTLGGNQVGKAAISGWIEFVQPLVGEGAALWPFDGSLADLLDAHSCVIAETYPAEFYPQLGLVFGHDKGSGKRSQQARMLLSDQLLSETRAMNAKLTDAAIREIEDGFGSASDGEDRFDAMVGLLGMLKHVLGGARVKPPVDEEILRVEGWMLGQSSLPARAKGLTVG